jgi:hypothetical protein
LGALRELNLSFNSLASLEGVLASLAPLGASLEQLQLNDNPLAAEWRPEGQQHQGDGPQQLAAAARAAVFRVLPHLRELDRQPVGEGERAQHLLAAARRRLPSARPWAPAAAAVEAALVVPGERESAEWEAQTALWVLSQPAAAAAVRQAQEQQQALAAARVAAGLEGGVAAGLACALASLGQAAAAGSAIAAQYDNRRFAEGSTSLIALRQAQQQYILLAAAEAPAAQSLLLLNPTHYQQLLSRLHTAATCIQAAWRRRTARSLRQQRAAERQASAQAAAATSVQAAWRGWVCRERQQRWVQHRLVIWRQQWQEAQQQVQEHQQRCSAVHIQVRGGHTWWASLID